MLPSIFSTLLSQTLMLICTMCVTTNTSTVGKDEIQFPSSYRGNSYNQESWSTTTARSSSNRQFGDIFSGTNFRVLTPTTTQAPEPFIEPISLNTTVYVGQTASLPCIVKHLGDKTVSWIRGSDLHILTSGRHTYTNDPRMILTHHDGKLRHLWTLNIKDIEKGDDGIYECQLNTEPKLTSTHYLHVLIEPLNDEGTQNSEIQTRDSPLASLDSRMYSKFWENEARILGPATITHNKGDKVSFICLVPHTRPSTNVSWFLDDIPIERSSATRGEINIETEVYTYSIMSKLIIFHAFQRDEGKYSCGGLSIYPASVILRVHDDSRPERVDLIKQSAGSSSTITAARRGMNIKSACIYISIILYLFN